VPVWNTLVLRPVKKLSKNVLKYIGTCLQNIKHFVQRYKHLVHNYLKFIIFLPHWENQHMCIIHVQEKNSNSKCMAIIQVCYSLFIIENSFPIYIDWVMQVGLVMSSSFPNA
jgi:hypothetical protein